jgi:F-type H+-transporting ATPase subunit b
MNVNATFIGEMIAFVVFVIFCMKYVWPPIIGAIEARQATIADGLAASDRAAKDLELAQQKATAQLKEAKAQAAEIIEAAKKTRNAIS